MYMKKIFICTFVFILGVVLSGCGDDNETTDIHWAILCSTDLLDFVTPVVSYTDEAGNKIDKELNDSDWDRSGKIHLGNATNFVELTGIENAWQEEVKVNTFGYTQAISVRYILKKEIKFDPNKDYVFTHDIVCKVFATSDSNVSHSSYSNITVGKKLNAEEAEVYVEKLISASDRRVITIDSKGKITIN